jgi:small subunit ribosomal protein S20
VAKHLSVKKRHRQSLKANRRNRTVKSKLRTTLKQFEDIKEPEAKATNLRTVASVTDKAAAKGVIHRNKAARIKSRAAKQTAAATTAK